MVEEIKAWKSSDGLTHASYEKAIEYEARLKLLQIFDKNEGMIKHSLIYASEIVEALEPLANLQKTLVEPCNVD